MITPSDFIRMIEDYYGEYSQAQKTVIMVYLPKFPRGKLQALYERITESIESKYKTPPDIAAMLPIMREIQDQHDFDALTAKTSAQLPPPGDVVSPEEGRRFMAALMQSIADGNDPRQDENVLRILREHGVEAQVKGETL